MEKSLVESPKGLYCPAGDFYLDPRAPVGRAIISHAHGDHATWGCESYLTSTQGRNLLKVRVGSDANIQGLDFGQPIQIGDARVTLYPAGHILGSSQILVEAYGARTVFSGDYKTSFDPSCGAQYEPICCDTFITESTFGLPIYQWQPQQQVFNEMNKWWEKNRAEELTSVLLAYSLGKAQRILCGVDASIGPIFVHGSVMRFDEAYREQRIALPRYEKVDETTRLNKRGALVIAPPSVQGTSWLNKLSPLSLGFASGWMQVRGVRRRKGIDKGFVLSDHADFSELTDSVVKTGAQRVLVTHGYRESYSRFLNEKGIVSEPLAIDYLNEEGEET